MVKNVLNNLLATNIAIKLKDYVYKFPKWLASSGVTGSKPGQVQLIHRRESRKNQYGCLYITFHSTDIDLSIKCKRGIRFPYEI